MNLEALETWFEKHLHDTNYQYRDLSLDQIDERAKKSFNRLPEKQRAKVVEVCKRYGLKDIKVISRYRFMAQTNLFALCKLLEKYRDVSDYQYVWTDGTVHNTHESICNWFFVRKDPTFATQKDFAIQYIEEKERLLLVPRGGFKSTMNKADCVQYTICWPEVKMLILTGVLKLAHEFVEEIKGHFILQEADASWTGVIVPKKAWKPRDSEFDPTTPLMFQVLFPEHCIPLEEGKASEYRSPLNPPGDKPTLFAASIDQNLSGFHVGVMKLDDVVTNENSGTSDRLKNVNKQVSIDKAMLNPYGFYDKIGTWYDIEDTYGLDIRAMKKAEQEGETFPMRVYIRPCWWPNEEAVKAGKIPEEMTKSDYVLWFDDVNVANRLSYEFLKKEQKDPYFAIKYLNNPLELNKIKFPRELLVRRTCNAVEVPNTGLIVTCVDTAWSTKDYRDFTVIITALIYGGRFYVIDMKRDRYNEYELPKMIASVAATWKPRHICIEETGAVKYVQRETYREMDTLQVRCPIRLVPLGQGKKNAKMTKAGPVLRLLGDERLWFVNTCPQLDDLYDEVSKFGTASATHDDIVDALAILVNEFSGYADLEGKMQASSAEFVIDPKSKWHYDQVHGLGAFAKFNASKQDGWVSQENWNAALEFPDQSPSDLANEAIQQAAASFYDPLGDLI